MSRLCALKGLFLAALLLGGGTLYTAFADHDEHKNHHEDKKKDRKDTEHGDHRDLAPVNNATYMENCGACHFAYQPGFLPSESWGRILAGLTDHFGETVEFDPDSMKTIAEYLKTHAADRSSAKLSRKIMKSLRGRTPLRITEIPYIQREHHEIDAGVFARESIGSFSNCTACHKTALNGVYDDDFVDIPR